MLIVANSFLKKLIQWVKKIWYIYIYIYIYTHTHSVILLSHKKNEIWPFAVTWIDLESIMLSEISQTEKDKYCMISLTCAI